MIRKYTTILLVLLTSLLLASCATAPRYAGNSTDAQAVKKESDGELGVRYLLGRGVPQNDQLAFKYFLSAAKDDDAFAQNEVAYLYAAGKGTEQDFVKAFEYYQKAANHGLASAQYNLGLLYATGKGVVANQEQALHWFKVASDHGFEPAKRALKKYAHNSETAVIQ